VVNQKFEGDRYTNTHVAWHIPMAAYYACRGSQHLRFSDSVRLHVRQVIQQTSGK